MGGSEVSSAFRASRAHAALWVLAGISGAWLVFRNWNMWFGGDDWFILLDRRINPGPGQLGVFEPHFEHWSTVPILAFRGLVAVVGVASYWPYVVLLVAVHIAIVVLLWHLMVRSGIDPWLALGFTAIVAVPGVGFEDVTNAWQVQLISPLALGLAALLLLPERGPLRPRDAGVSLLLTVAMACSGLAITMLAVVAFVALVRRGPRVAISIAVLPAGAYAWWYAAYGSKVRNVTRLSYGPVPGFVWDGLTDTLGDVVRLRGLGVVIVLATFGWLVCQLTHRPIAPTLLLPSALALGAVVWLTLTGWRRAAITVPSLSRYAYVTVVLLLPLVAAATDWLVRRASRTRFGDVVPIMTAIVIVAVVVGQVRILEHWITKTEPTKRVEKAAFLNTALLARDRHQFFLHDVPLSQFEPQVTVAKVVRLDHEGKLPSLRGLREDDRYTVLARLDLAIVPMLIHGLRMNPNRVRLGAVRRARTTPAAGRPDCTAFDARRGATVQLLTKGKVGVGIRGRGNLAMHVARRDGRVRGLDVVAPLGPGDLVLNVGPIDGGAVVLTLPRGATTLCGVS
jgi:hypothetical protein